MNDLREMGIKVWCPYENERCTYNFQPFNIRAFRLDDSEGRFVHSNADGSECPIYGFYIMCDGEVMVYATDCEFIKYRFTGIQNLLLGINYSDEQITTENESKRRHILNGHLALNTALEFIRVTDRDKTLKRIVVGHLSSENSNRDVFEKAIREVTDADIYFAKKGLRIT